MNKSIVGEYGLLEEQTYGGDENSGYARGFFFTAEDAEKGISFLGKGKEIWGHDT